MKLEIPRNPITEKTCKEIENKKKNSNKMIDNRMMMKDNEPEDIVGANSK